MTTCALFYAVLCCAVCVHCVQPHQPCNHCNLYLPTSHSVTQSVTLKALFSPFIHWLNKYIYESGALFCALSSSARICIEYWKHKTVGQQISIQSFPLIFLFMFLLFYRIFTFYIHNIFCGKHKNILFPTNISITSRTHTHSYGYLSKDGL